MPMKLAAQALRHRAGGAGSAERVEHDVAGPRRGEDDAREQRLRLLGRMELLAVAALEPLLAGAQRKRPVGADLDVLVAGLEGLVVERVLARRRVARGPDQSLVGVGEAAAAKIRHRVRLAPDHVVEDPEAEVLENGADAEDVVIGADHPQRGVGLHHPPAGDQPGPREIVIGGEAENLSQSSSTASTRESSGRLRSPLSWRL